MSERLLERAAMGHVFEAGEVLFREHLQPFGGSRIPYALELIEAERLCDEMSTPYSAEPGNEIRLGVEVDRYYRAVAYHLRARHGSELRWMGSQDRVTRVPADQIIHLRIVDRWPQSRGEPWMHTAITRMNDMDGYSEAEILRARAQAVRMGIIETPEGAESFAEQQEDGSYEMELEPNVVGRLNPGEKWIDSNPSAPNPNMDPFMRYMLREIGSGMGVSYASLSGDYSQSNYSSSRLALLDDRDLWRFYQCWFIDEFRTRIHRRWLTQAVIAGAIPSLSPEQYFANIENYQAVKFKPRGWSWIDPPAEVDAFKEAVKAGFTTRTDIIASTAGGQDIEDIDETRERELAEAKELGLEYDTDPAVYMADAKEAEAKAKAAARPPPDLAPSTNDEGSAPPKTGRTVLGVVK
jgi:lambda family phage portal protein